MGEEDRTQNPAELTGSARQMALTAANGLDQVITTVCRFVVMVTGVALTVILTANVVARYAFAAGGLDAAQELPERLFPWFIVAGIALAAQAGGHMAVDWLLGRVGSRGGRWLLLFGNAIVIASYALLFREAMLLAEIAKIEAARCCTCLTATATGRWRSASCSSPL